jgi:hypothetical protein
VPENFLKSRFRLIATLSALTFALAGCAELPASAPIEQVDYRGCLVAQSDASDQTLADLADYSLNQAAVSYGIKRTNSAATASKLAPAVKKLTKAECKLIAVAGAGFAQDLIKVAKSYPEANFVYFTDVPTPSLSAANLDNLVVFGVDLHEVGLISGYLAASQSRVHRIALSCGQGLDESFVRGAKWGAAQFDMEADSITRVDARVGSMVTGDTELPDVYLTAGCRGAFKGPDQSPILVGYGRDNFLSADYAAVKSQIAATVTPKIGDKLLEVIASDLEGDFVGGSLGSVTASYGNGLIALAPEHDVTLSAATLTKLQTVVADYEAGLK